MFNSDQCYDSLGIFYANLIPFHIFGMIISWLTFAICFWKIPPSNNNKNEKLLIQENLAYEKDSTEEMSFQTRYKLAGQKLLEQDSIPDQRSKEEKE